MEKKPVLYPYRRSTSTPVNMPYEGGLKKGPQSVEKDHAHFASSFLAERGCLSPIKAHKHSAA